MKSSLSILVTLAAALFVVSAFAATKAEAITDTSTNSNIQFSGPETAKVGIVLVHDWFGPSPFYSQAIQRLAKDGYRIAAVDLYKGQHANTHGEADNLMQNMNREEAAQLIDAAVSTLSHQHRQLAIMGFSMGAKFALNTAIKHPEINASILWYGETLNDPAELKKLSGPVLFIVGSKDGAAADNAASFSKASDTAGVSAEIFLYPGAAHAFAQPLFNEGKTYDPEAAALAWRISEDFLKRRLK